MNNKLLEQAFFELINISGFRPYNTKSFFNYLSNLIKKTFDEWPKIFKCFYTTFFLALVANTIVMLMYRFSLDKFRYIELARIVLIFISSGCLAWLFANLISSIFESIIYLVSSRHIFIEALYDITSFILLSGALSFGFVASIDTLMHLGYGIVNSLVLILKLDPFASFPIY